ncbi:MAG: tetratricopeptide repeat protein [Bacteroidales bacterium]|nr:tetratricopeptide repeat protein [Bacteroidales bacterium]
MLYKKFRTIYKKICNYITEKKLADAFLLIEENISRTNNLELIHNFEKQKETYGYLLEYTFKGIDDPQKPAIYKRIQTVLEETAEQLNDYYFLNDTNNRLSAEKRVLNVDIIKNKTTVESEINQLLSIKKGAENNERKSALYKLFFFIWLSNGITDNDLDSLRKLSRSKKILFHEKSIIVSALTISLIRRFDEKKLISLFDFYDADENAVWNRALVGIVISFYVYNKRMYLHDDLIKKLKQIKKDDGIEKHIEDIILQFIRTKETEKISKKLRDEIIPEMQKFRPKIEEKLNLDDILSDNLIEDKNPDWEELFDDAPELLGKMADFSKMQLEGSDVFMSAFAMFKNFPFFKQPANWFMPFYAENEEVKNAFSDFDENFDAEAFAKGLERSAFMCNSDKYSFCMNVQMMPKAQRSMIVELFKTEMQQMKEISDDDELLNKGKKDKQIFTRYIQDLYRFFKLHPLHKEFDDFFDSSFDIYNTLLFDTIIKDNKTLKIISELYFKKGFYNEAIDALSKLKLKGKAAQKNFEKLGFAWQKLKNYDKASEHYKKAELFGEASLWLTKKIAFCYRKNRNYEEALKYYQKAEKEEDNNLHIQANIGHCYLSMENHEEALKKYFKVEYYEPDNLMVKRPIAWCSFVLGKFDISVKYYSKLLENKPTVFDYINFGHVLFCKGDKMKAVEMYLKAIKMKDLKTFENSIKEDKEMLLKHGSEQTDIDLLMDYVKTKMLQ